MAITRAILSAVCFGLISIGPAPQAQEDFGGKTVRIVIGTAVGGSYGVFAQLVSRHMPRHLPGNPAMITVAMPGAGGLVALNYLGSDVPPKDGTTITLAHVTLVQENLLNEKAKYDAREFKWIGRLDSLTVIGLASRASGIKSIQDARTREVIAGSPGLSNIPGQAPLILNKIAGTKFKSVSGYKGTGEVFLALERGEVDVAATSLASLQALHAAALKKGDLIPIFVHAGKRLSEFPSVPTLSEFADSEIEKKFMRVISLTAELGRSLAVPPGTPDEVLKVYRAAYAKMLKDPEFSADAKKAGVDIDPLDGEELTKLVDEAMDVRKDEIVELRTFYKSLFSAPR